MTMSTDYVSARGKRTDVVGRQAKTSQYKNIAIYLLRKILRLPAPPSPDTSADDDGVFIGRQRQLVCRSL